MNRPYTVFRKEEVSATASRRPRLSRLEPIGLGTGDVESLTSYLVRIANDHWVSPRRLYLDLVEQNCGKKVRPLKPNAGLDGCGNAARRLTDALTVFSPLDVQFSDLSCMPWKDIVSIRQQGVMAGSMRWCVFCYRDMKSNGQPLHNKLLWSLKPVEVCPTHDTYLSKICLSCERQPDLNRSNSVMGCCSACGAQLIDQETSLAPTDDGHSEKRRWTARSLHDFVRFTREERPKRESLLHTLEALIETIGQGSRVRIARELNLPRDTVRGWIRPGKRPNLGTFLEFCYRLDIPPTKMFEKTGVLVTGPRRVRPTRVQQKRTPMSDAQFERVRTKLRTLIESGVELGTQSDVAKRVGISTRMLADRYPEENTIVADRGRVRRAKEKEERDVARCERVSQWARDLIAKGIYPSERQIKKAKRMYASDLRNPKVLAVLRPLQKRYKDQLSHPMRTR